MSVRSEKTVAPSPSEAMAAAITEAQPVDASLAEGAAFATAQPENPLNRSVVVSVRASLNELCLQKQKGTWQPSAEAMRSILQQKVSVQTPTRWPLMAPLATVGLRPPLTRAHARLAEVHRPRGLGGAAGRPQGMHFVVAQWPRFEHWGLPRVCSRPVPCHPPPLAVGGPPQDERLARQVDVPVLSWSTHHRRRRQDLLVHRRVVLDHRYVLRRSALLASQTHWG